MSLVLMGALSQGAPPEAACALPIVLWGSFAPLAAAIGYGLAVWYGFRQFDGMSGDISGFGLVLGELCGAVVLALGR